MELTITNSKYFREWDNSDNPCCWQIELIGEDIGSILTSNSILYDDMYEDWGLGLAWKQDVIEYSIMVTCIDPETAAYNILFEAFRKRFFVLNRLVQIEETPYASLIEKFRTLDEGS